jgi:hypothetical protein
VIEQRVVDHAPLNPGGQAIQGAVADLGETRDFSGDAFEEFTSLGRRERGAQGQDQALLLLGQPRRRHGG